MIVFRISNRFGLFRALLGLVMSLAAAGSLEAGEAGVSLRVVDESAPPGGLAVVAIELTEPKPLSGGRVRFAYGGGPLGEVLGVALLDGVGQVEATLISTQQGAVVQFSSSMATFGTSPDLPIMVVAISVSPAATPGQTVALDLDLGDSTFLDPQGQPYPGEVKAGVFTVGGVSITGIEPTGGPVAAGGVIRVSGVGFQAGFDLNIEGASIASDRLNGPGEIEATLAAGFTILPTTRFRLRNPDGSEDFFYPAAVTRPEVQNRAPLAQTDTVTTQEDTAVEIDVLSNDSDPDGDALFVETLQQPGNGAAQIVSGGVLYTPRPDYAGTDNFSYTVADGRGGGASALVTVVVQPVNDPPAVMPDRVATAPDQPVEISVLDNDSDVDGDPLSLLGVFAFDRGFALVSDSGGVVYFPPPDFQGEARFQYQAGDGQGGVSDGSVEVSVRLPDLPPSAADDASVTSLDSAVEIFVLENDSDPNASSVAIENLSPPLHGMAESDGGRVLYRPPTGYVGADFFDYRVSDESGLATGASVAVAVNSPDSPFRFVGEPRRLVAGSSAVVEIALDEPFAAEGRLEISSSSSEVVQAPEFVTIPGGADAVRFRIQASGPGVAVLEARRDGIFQGLPLLVSDGMVTEVPVGLFNSRSGVGLALANRSPREVVIRLRDFPSAPNADLDQSETEIVLGPFQQASRPLAEYDPGLADFRGWIEVASPDVRVFPMFLNFAARLRGLAGTSATVQSTGYVLPCFGGSGGAGFDFSLINNNFVPAIVDLSWSGASGTQRHEQVEVGPQQAFAAPDPGEDGCENAVVVGSSQPLAAYQQFETPDLLWGLAPPSTVPASSRLHLPQSVSGLGWVTMLSLTNHGASADEVELTFQGDGPAERATLVLAEGASRHLPVSEIFGWSPEEFRVGSLEIVTSGGIAASSAISLEGPPKITTASPVFSETHREVVFPQAVSGNLLGVDFFTGLAVQNPGPGEALVVIDVFSAEGEFRGMGGLRLAPGERFSRLLDELLPDLGTLAGGHVRVRSTAPVAAVEIFGDRGLNFLSTVAPAIVD